MEQKFIPHQISSQDYVSVGVGMKAGDIVWTYFVGSPILGQIVGFIDEEKEIAELRDLDNSDGRWFRKMTTLLYQTKFEAMVRHKLGLCE